MRLKNTLLVAGLCLLLDCTNDDNSRQLELRVRLDSTVVANKMVIDSLNQHTLTVQSNVDILEADDQAMTDSIATLNELKSKIKNAPKISPTIPRGDPVEIPIQTMK